MDSPSGSKEADRPRRAQRIGRELRGVEVNLPIVLGKLRNLVSVGESSNHKLLRDKVGMSIQLLESISEWIRVAEEQKVSSDIIEDTMSKLPSRLNLIEDVIDTFLVKTELRWGRKLIKMKMMRPLISFTSLLDKIVFSDDIGKFIHVVYKEEAFLTDKKVEKLYNFEEYLNDQYERWIYKDAGRYPEQERPPDWQPVGSLKPWVQEEDPVSFYRLDDTDVVGLQELQKELVARLQQFGPNVIAVTGMAGSGKTTLTKKVYDKPNIRRYFDYRFWFGYPEDAEAEDILVNILTQVKGERGYKHLPLSGLQDRLRNFLKEKSCLIVIDDVRTRNDFDKLQIVLQCTSVTTRVVITTRDEDVASVVGHRLQLRSLTDEESWTLFLKKVVRRVDRLADPVLIQLKEKILRKCDGSPKAIVILAGLLSTRDLTDWSSVIEEELEENILALSYQDLPLHMKLCFLYLGLFPRAFQIPVRRLLHLWRAEGLVTPLPEQNMASQDVAEKYLKELINRRMIEVARLRSDGSPKTCRMPGFLWDFFFPKAVTLGLFHVHNYTCAEPPKFNVLRLAESVGIKNYPSSDPYIQHLRSYISFNTRKRDLPAQEIGTFLNSIVTKRGFGLLRVLDLEGVYKPMLPEILRKFLHLKYIGLRWTFLDSLPLSIGTLPYLETLDVKHTNIITLPSSIWKAKNLQHLYMSEIHFDMSLQKLSGTGSLTNLQTLWGLYIGNKSLVDNCLNKLTALRKLGLTFNSTSVEAIAEWISQLTNLQSLRLRSSNEFGRPEALMLGTMTEHQKLSDLYLLGQLPRAICENQLPPNLKILTLSASKLEEDPMPMLGKLPHLNILRLFGNSFTGKQIACLCEGFPELRVLKLWMLEELEEWIVEEGTMPCLRELEIRRCFNLKQPEGLRLVTTLQDLILTNMPEDFVTNVKRVMDKRVFIKENNLPFAPLQV